MEQRCLWQHHRLHQQSEREGFGRGVEHPSSFGFDARVVDVDDRCEQAVSPAEVVVERRRVALPGGLDHGLQRSRVDTVLREEPTPGADQPLAGVGGIAGHQILWMMVPVATAPPQHIVIIANSASRRSSSCRAVVMRRLPVEPTG